LIDMNVVFLFSAQPTMGCACSAEAPESQPSRTHHYDAEGASTLAKTAARAEALAEAARPKAAMRHGDFEDEVTCFNGAKNHYGYSARSGSRSSGYVARPQDDTTGRTVADRSPPSTLPALLRQSALQN
jgi:hypothetical protein